MDEPTSPQTLPPRATPAAVVALPGRAPIGDRRRARTSRADRAVVWAMVAVGVVVALRAPGAPTGLWWADAAWRAGFAVAVVLAASRARRWAWIVAPAVLTLASDPWSWMALGALAVLAGVASVPRHRRRGVGAAIGVVCVGVALHLPPVGAFGGSAAVAAVGVAPLLVSGYRASPARPQRWVRWSVAALVLVVVAGGVAAFTAAMLAWTDVTDAESAARAGLVAAEGGDTTDATGQLQAASTGFGSAAQVLDAWWVQPARVVPVVGQHADALAVAARQGATVTDAAATSAAAIDLDQLRLAKGRLDLDQLAAAAPSLVATSDGVGEATGALAAVDSPWLVGPLRGRLADFRGELDDVAPDAELAALAAEELPGLLGADGPRRYLLAFTTPAEMRGAGGFVGSWAVLEADGGHLELVEQGRAADVNERPGRDERAVTQPPDYVARYARFRPGYWFQDVTLSPDVPSSAAAAAEVFAQAGYAPVDGVVLVDAEGLSALLRLTGPVEVPSLGRRLGADDVVDWLLRDQYLEPLSQDGRADLLGDVATATFDALLAADLPGPRRLADVLGPPTETGHLSAVAFDEGAASLLDRLGATRAFPTPDGGDLAGLVTQNSANNKIDVYLRRAVDYDVRVDPTTGQVAATARVALTNEAPAEGLPEAVIGSNDRGLAPGTNRLYLSWYSPLRLGAATLDGEPLVMERQRELGSYVYSATVEIPSGATRVIEMDLAGLVTLDGGGPGGPAYRLTVPVQPLATPDDWRVQVDAGPGDAVEPPGLTWSPELTETLRFALRSRG